MTTQYLGATRYADGGIMILGTHQGIPWQFNPEKMVPVLACTCCTAPALREKAEAQGVNLRAGTASTPMPESTVWDELLAQHQSNPDIYQVQD